MKLVTQTFDTVHALFATRSITSAQANARKTLEDTIEASVAVLAVFAWLAAMTLLP